MSAVFKTTGRTTRGDTRSASSRPARSGIRLHASDAALERQAAEIGRASRDRLPLSAGAATPGRDSGPWPNSALTRFADSLGYDLDSIRIHTDARAQVMSDWLNARAVTYGRDLHFARDEYAPGTFAGRELIAHEMAHAVQQSQRSVGERLQCACRPPSPTFDLSGSGIGQALRAALAGVTIQVRSRTAPSGWQAVPRVDPVRVLRLLASSPCFLRDASAVNVAYCGGQGGCASRLNLNFHDLARLGSEFVPGRPATLRVEVTDLASVVRHIVHEIAHAVPARRRGTWPTAVSRGWGRHGGAVTRQVRRRLREESRTRQREHEVLQEIQASPDWRSLLGTQRVPVTPHQPEGVRASFVSGQPRLTYQESFIVDAMLRRYDTGMTEDDKGRARAAARGMLAAGVPQLNQGNVASYRLVPQGLAAHRTRLRQAAPSPAPPVPAVRDCIEIYNRHERRLDRARGQLRQRHRYCPAFIELFRRELRIPFSVQNEAGRTRALGLRNTMQDRYDRLMVARRASTAVTRWYDGLSAQVRRNQQSRVTAWRYLSWVLIGEAMSREWARHASADPVIRRQHLELMMAMGGGLLAGVRMPAPTPAAGPTSGGTP